MAGGSDHARIRRGQEGGIVTEPSAKSRTAVYITPDGTVYRVAKAEVDRLSDEWREDYDILTLDGAQTKRNALPDDAVLVWSPAPTSAEIRRLADQLRGGWHVPSGYWGLAHNVLRGLCGSKVQWRWAVIAVDDDGITVERTGDDPAWLADDVASWAQQETDRWPEHGLIYMLVSPEEHELVVED